MTKPSCEEINNENNENEYDSYKRWQLIQASKISCFKRRNGKYVLIDEDNTVLKVFDYTCSETLYNFMNVNGIPNEHVIQDKKLLQALRKKVKEIIIPLSDYRNAMYEVNGFNKNDLRILSNDEIIPILKELKFLFCKNKDNNDEDIIIPYKCKNLITLHGINEVCNFIRTWDIPRYPNIKTEQDSIKHRKNILSIRIWSAANSNLPKFDWNKFRNNNNNVSIHQNNTNNNNNVTDDTLLIDLASNTTTDDNTATTTTATPKRSTIHKVTPSTSADDPSTRHHRKRLLSSKPAVTRAIQFSNSEDDNDDDDNDNVHHQPNDNDDDDDVNNNKDDYSNDEDDDDDDDDRKPAAIESISSHPDDKEEEESFNPPNQICKGSSSSSTSSISIDNEDDNKAHLYNQPELADLINDDNINLENKYKRRKTTTDAGLIMPIRNVSMKHPHGNNHTTPCNVAAAATTTSTSASLSQPPPPGEEESNTAVAAGTKLDNASVQDIKHIVSDAMNLKQRRLWALHTLQCNLNDIQRLANPDHATVLLNFYSKYAGIRRTTDTEETSTTTTTTTTTEEIDEIIKINKQLRKILRPLLVLENQVEILEEQLWGG